MFQMSPNCSGTGGVRYRRIVAGRACAGIRLNLRKISIRRLKARFLRFFGFLRRRFFCRSTAASSACSSSGSCFSSAARKYGDSSKSDLRKRCESSEYCRMKSLGRTNSFYTEAIADCLEFIKRSSGASALDISSDRPPLVA